jgi:iron(III) transport system substrate-binding protein
MKLHRTLLASLAAALAALTAASVGAAAGGPPPMPANMKAVLAKVAGKSPAQREQILYGLAKAEGGTVDWYTTISKTIGPSLVDAFQKQYPGLTVSMYRAGSDELAAKLYAEAAAHANGADVIETDGTQLLFMQHKKTMLVPYRRSPFAAAIPKTLRFDTFTTERVEAFTTTWNTNLVKSGDEPTSYADLASPRWAGKLEMEPGDVDWFAFVYGELENAGLKALKPQPATPKAKTAALAKIDRNVDAIFTSMSRNAQMVGGHTNETNLLAAGQASVCVSCYAQPDEALMQKKAPIAFSPAKIPLILRPQGVAIPYWVQHPAGALLFYDWMLDPNGGQKVLLAGGANPARPDMRDPMLKPLPSVYMDIRPVVNHYGAWLKKYEAITQLGKK